MSGKKLMESNTLTNMSFNDPNP